MELYEKKTWKRTEILRHLREQIKEKKPILMGAAGIGLVAKMEANAGIDLINITIVSYLAGFFNEIPKI